MYNAKKQCFRDTRKNAIKVISTFKFQHIKKKKIILVIIN